MPPSINPFPVLRTVALRPRPIVVRRGDVVKGAVGRRTFADKSKAVPEAEQGAVGPNMQQAEHVSEEAAKMAKIQGGEGPDIEGQGTPVQDILREEKETRKNAPQVLKEDVKAGNTTKPQTRQFSTYARRRLEVQPTSNAPPALEQSFAATSFAPSQSFATDTAADYTATTQSVADVEPKGHKFPLPPIPLPRELVKDHRYDPVVNQVTNLLMKDGKKSVAQRNMSVILNILRTAPAPTYNANRPLLPGAPPASHLPLNPVLYLTLAVDSVAPLLRIRSQRGAAGGGVALQIPVPLGIRQRRRTAFMWILDAAVKRKSKGSGNDMFATKVADEIIAIVEGRSSVWEKRTAVHKLATTARANLNYSMRGRR